MLVSSNGLAVAGYDVTQNRITSFLEHPYRTRSDGAQTRDVAYDLYPGLRVGSTGTWLGDVTPSSVAYEVGTGIIHVQRTVSGLSVDEYQFVPIGLAERALAGAREGRGETHVLGAATPDLDRRAPAVERPVLLAVAR